MSDYELIVVDNQSTGGIQYIALLYEARVMEA